MKYGVVKMLPFAAMWDVTRGQYMLRCRICGTDEYEGGKNGGWKTPADVRDRGVARHNRTGHFPVIKYRWDVSPYGRKVR